MAFGFGFNKQKVLGAAEKYVQQGKLQNAIAEYEKILKNDPKDLTVLNTVGDLYARIGENDKATECFKSVGDAYAAQGFTVKGIAMYKKISKLKPSLESVLKLAELYTQQGLFNDARAQYLQVAEEFLRAGELEQSVRIFQKILEMDPDNVQMRVRLAEVYIRLGKKEDAWQIFSAAADSLRARGSLLAAEEILQRMLTLDPANPHALMLRGRTALEGGDAAAAIGFFEKINNLDAHPDGVRDLFKAYLQAGRTHDAGKLAAKLLAAQNDLEPTFAYLDALVQGGYHDEALQVIDQNLDRLIADNVGRVQEGLHSLIGHLAGNPAALEKVLELLQKTGESSHLNEVTELLAHACVQTGDLAKARDLYQHLAQQEPQNGMHMQNYQQVVGMMAGGTGSRLITVEEGAVLVEELETTAPPISQAYSPEIAMALRAALTDAELFVSYNMPDKALGPLMAALPIAPMDVRLNQRLAALHTRSERFADAAACCRNLEQVYAEAGYPEESLRYGELAQRYEERSSVGPMTHAAEAAALPATASAAPWPVQAAAVEEMEVAAEPADFEVSIDERVVEEAAEEVAEEEAVPELSVEPGESEIDLSAEWDGETAVEEEAPVEEVEAEPAESTEDGIPVASGDPVAETIEEIRFYLEHSMVEQARTAYAKLETLTDDPEKLATMLSEVMAASGGQEAEPEVAVEEEAAPVAEDEFTAQVEIAAQPEAEPQTEFAVPEEAAQEEHEPAAMKGFVADVESSLGSEFALPARTEEFERETLIEAHAGTDPGLVSHLEFMKSAPPAHGEAGEETRPAEEVAVGETPAGALDEFVADLEESLGDGFMQDAAVVQPEHEGASAVAHKEAAPPQTAKPKTQPAPVSAPAPAAVPVSPVRMPAPVAAPAQPTMAASAAAPAPALEPLAPAVAARSAVIPGPVRQALDAIPVVAPAAAAAGVDLADMFGEIKHELEEDSAAANEDPETHYSLGVAFREMGLLDEAIGELQKVIQAVDHGHPFPQIMQTYTWLAQCFLDKGVPEAAIRWYDKALQLPGLDQETRTALHYELAASYESAQNRDAALKHFMEVYGSNIDYRDVGERIKALRS
jgi:tetratricopeptide (TPR) repeat protein